MKSKQCSLFKILIKALFLCSIPGSIYSESSEFKEFLTMMDRFNGEKLILSEEKWRERLTAEQFSVLRNQGTEPAFANRYYYLKEEGIYVCAGCHLPLFHSSAKYDSGTGWPSFWQPIFPENVSYREDFKLRQKRIEVICSRCEGHLGHVFEDGPKPTGKRYCMNSGALQFIPK